MPNVLDVINITKVYGQGVTQVKALNNVSFSVNKGEFILIVGSSGSGKSTLLNMIGLLDKPTEGRVLIDGIDTTYLDDDKISSFRNQKLGFIFQFSNLISDLTVLENVLLPAQIAHSNSSVKQDAIELLKTVGLEKQMNNKANEISGGQAQRAAIARALINNPTIILGDEPTGNLDSQSAHIIVDLMKSVAQRMHRTFIVVTHDRDQFGDVDRIITIKDGQLIETKEAAMSLSK